MPLGDVTYSSDVSDGELRRLAELLPDLIAEAVDCPEEPWTGPASVGDMQIRFRRQGDFDVGQLRVVIEVRTKLLGSRLTDRQRRADLVRDGLSSLELGHIGVWLILHEGAWSQTWPLSESRTFEVSNCRRTPARGRDYVTPQWGFAVRRAARASGRDSACRSVG